MSYHVRLIENPTNDHVEQAVALLVRAFEGDLSCDSMTGGRKELRPALFRSMLSAGVTEGHLYVATPHDDQEKIVSFGLCFAPGNSLFSSEQQLQAGKWFEFIGSLHPVAQQWWGETWVNVHLASLSKLLGDKWHGWFVNIVATDPDHQRRGCASDIIKTIQKRASDEGKTLALATQTDENNAWYNKRGFKTLGTFEITSESGNWPDHILLWDPTAQA